MPAKFRHQRARGVAMLIACANCGRETEILGDPGACRKCSCGNRITVPVRPPKPQFGVANCTNCWKRYGVVGRPTGTKFRCKACGEIITIRDARRPVQPPTVTSPALHDEATPLPSQINLPGGPAAETVQAGQPEEIRDEGGDCA